MNNSKLPSKLQQLVVEIENNRPASSAYLVEVLKGLELNESDFSELITYDHDPSDSYGRCLIHQGANFSIYLMTWLSGDFTAIHNHGLVDWGAVFFFGEMHHRLYEVNSNSITLKRADIISAGTIYPVAGRLVHAMGNLGNNAVCSLHIYGSNEGLINANNHSLIYDLERNLIKTTNGAAFINIKEKFVQQTETGLTCDIATLIDYLSIVKPFYERTNEHFMVNYINEFLATH